jgi:hypothetical protein
LAFALSLLLHLLLVYFLPDQLLPKAAVVTAAEPEVLELELEAVKPEEMRFVEANPDAPDNAPDESRNYSYRNQQAAEENPAPISNLNQPSVEGREASQKILEGQLPSPEVLPQMPPGQVAVTASATLSAVLLPLKGKERPEFLEQASNDRAGDMGHSELDKITKEARGEVDGALRIYQAKEANAATPIDTNGVPTQAKPRPRLDPKLLVGPLMESAGASSQQGKIAIDATFSEFGEYEQQFFAPVLLGWYQEIDFYQPIDISARVLVSLTMRADGSVTEVKAIESNATEVAKMICEKAISDRSPFRPWTKEMIEVFGQKRTLRVLFLYQ